MNNGIFSLGSPQTFPIFNSSNNLLGNISKIELPYGFSQGRSPQINYDNLVFVVDISKESTLTFILPLAGTVNCTVDWGDGVIEKFTTAGNKTHTYSSFGEYTIQIYGILTSFSFSTAGSTQPKLVKCLSFGNLPITSFNFQSCTNLIQVPSNIPTGVTSLASCFNGCTNFNWPIDTWDVSRITSLANTFTSCSNFNRDLSSWNTANITSMSNTFNSASRFNGNISTWNTSKVTTTSLMFYNTSFNQSVSSWDTSSLTACDNMFRVCPFNQNINSWNVSKVTSFSFMFGGASSFNQPLSGWNIGADASVSTIDMSFLFYQSAFNQDISNWNTSKVTTMQSIFHYAPFNQAVSGWNTSNVLNMANAFAFNTVFNQPIGSWDVSKVNSFATMFQNAIGFNQDISAWDIKGINIAGGLTNFMLNGSVLSTTNYNSLLVAWNSRKATYRTDLSPNFSTAKYSASPSAAATARAALVTYGWSISDGGPIITAPDAPTTVSGTAGNTQVSLTWSAPTYNNGAAITDYTIQYSSNSGSSWATFSDGVSTSTFTTVTGLTNGTSYIFRVAAINSAGTGSFSANSSSVTPVAPTTTTTTTTTTTVGPYGSFYVEQDQPIENDIEL